MTEREMAMLAMREQIFTLAEAAEALRVSPDTIMHLIKNKQLKASKVGSQWRITETAIERYLEEQSNIQEPEDKK